MTDMVESTPDGWDAYRVRHRGFDGAIGQTSRRAAQLWPLRVAAYGAPGGPPITDGIADHDELFDLSWKGRLGACAQRRRLLTRALDARGMARLYVLHAQDRPIASCMGVRIGPVVQWHTVAYDPAAAMLSPGNIVHWRAQELAFAEGPLELIDLLPGESPLKDRICSERPALLDVCAARVPGRVLPALRGARELERALPIATRTRLRSLRERWDTPATSTSGPTRHLEARPATATATHDAELVTDQKVMRLLAIACACKGPQQMRATWGTDDRWYRLGAAPLALARVDTGQPVPTLREVVRYDPAYTLEAIALMLADLLATPVRYTDAVPVRDPRLRWPAAWTHTPAESGIPARAVTPARAPKGTGAPIPAQAATPVQTPKGTSTPIPAEMGASRAATTGTEGV